MCELTSFSDVSLWHHGIKGMHWGIRRTPEELGHAPKQKAEKAVDKTDPETIMVQGKQAYASEKGFTVQLDKLNGYCLKPEAKHAEEFFRLGYTASDGLKLFRDIEAGFDPEKKIDEMDQGTGIVKFSIPMTLGVTDSMTFRTVWRTDGPDSMPRFVSTFVDRKLKEE